MTVNSIRLFDTWQADYGSAIVTFYKPGTTTKADIFTDVGLTVAAANPQTLESKTVNGQTFGKYTVPIYIDEAYYMDIDSTDQTGVIYPTLTSLDAQNIADAVAIANGASVSRALDIHLSQFIHAEDYGALVAGGASAADNTTTIVAAIAAATALSGGYVRLPAGNFTVNSFNLPGNVILIGQGMDVTTLTNQQAAAFITMTGDDCGLASLTLDGVNKVASGDGVFGIGIDRSIMEHVKIKRFDDGMHFKGGRHSKWYDLSISDCNTGAKLHGDEDSGGAGAGDEWTHNVWKGGKVDINTNVAIDLSFEDKPVRFNMFEDIIFDSNLDKTFAINGAQFTAVKNPVFTGNLKNFDVQDDTDTSFNPNNTVIGLHVVNGGINTGQLNFQDTCLNVIFEKIRLIGVVWTLTTPDHHITLVDCTSDAASSIAGSSTMLINRDTIQEGVVVGSTSDATPTTAWNLTLEAGQLVSLDVVAIGNQKEAVAEGVYHIGQFAHRPGDTLDYDAQSANFTAGQVVTGSTSGATALIIADSDSGTSGTLTLRNITGVFENNETITDPLGGSATVDGTLTAQAAVLLGSLTTHKTAVEDVAGWNVLIAVTNQDVEVTVTGAAGDTIEWTLHVRAVLD